jgi:endonuclease/exonuclease/phosphatase family metal-dependent hydrolase
VTCHRFGPRRPGAERLRRLKRIVVATARNKTNLFTDDAKHDSESYAYLLKYFRDLGRDAGETSINDRRIDYVFGPPKTVSLRRAEVLRGTAVGRMDHWPLLVEVGY